MTPEQRHSLGEALTLLGAAVEEQGALVAQAQPLTVAAGVPLLARGRAPQRFFLLLRGLCHGVYLTEQGRQFSKEFFWEGDWLVGYESLLERSSSPFELQALTDAELVSLPVTALQQWRSQRHIAYLTLLETQLIHKERKERLLLLSTPEQRYRHFCQHHPELLPRLADYQIAAYLGITPISLSRIKSRLRGRN